MVPSLGRPADDFVPVVPALESAGFTCILLEPRPRWEGEATLHDLASDAVARIDAMGIARFHLVGHAFGNRLSRTMTADYNDRVESLVLLAAGGLVEPSPGIWDALGRCFDTALDWSERRHAVRTVFFAEGNDPDAWRGGWMPEVFRYQRAAVLSTPREDWWGASTDRVMVVQALQDAVAPPENGRRYVAEHAPHARLVEIDGAGHAMLPEQPEVIATALVDFLSA
jgi:pimeloyl-ACP methyl ester carboxylesterase